VIAIFAIAAASWAVLMAVAPLLQLRRMVQRHSSADVSVGYLLVLVPGFALWVGYGIASSDVALVVPNLVALIVASVTVVCALRLRP
jgi:MtN3 and saliva related transmembrane protein